MKSGVDRRSSPNTAPNCSAIAPHVIRLAHRQSPPDPYSSNATSMPVGSSAAAISRSGVAAFSNRGSLRGEQAEDEGDEARAERRR